MATEFAFRPGASFQKGAHADPQIIGEHLEFLRDQNGGKLTREMVLEDAKGANSPLHQLLPWDDSEAANKYRLLICGQIVRSVVVRFRKTEDEGPQTVRAFVSIKKDGERHYTSVVSAMNDEDMRKQTIRKAWNELQQFRAKYRGMTEFASLFSSLDEIEESLPPVLGIAN